LFLFSSPLSLTLEIGTETAYAVSGEARALKNAGKRIYSFHIGDLNFPTPKPIVDACKKALDEGKTGYVAAAGVEELVTALAKSVGEERGVTYTNDEVGFTIS
jgi:aspartate/methionine/tyrosine aminotransferase